MSKKVDIKVTKLYEEEAIHVATFATQIIRDMSEGKSDLMGAFYTGQLNELNAKYLKKEINFKEMVLAVEKLNLPFVIAFSE
jgi:hypothetical protein